jgi:hypothetical protein
MRVGIPHKSGKLAAHAFNEGYPAMVSANAFWNARAGEFRFPQYTDLMDIDWALDSAGYTAIKMWQEKGTQVGMAGVFPWTYQQYIELASEARASWYSAPDLCCEPEIASNQTAIDYRLDATATLLYGCLEVIYDWQSQLAIECSPSIVADVIRPPVPVIQGYSISDYLRSLDQTMEVWNCWADWLAPPALIGLGSVCRRDLNHPKHGLYAILEGLDGNIPAGTKVHLFGVKGECLSRIKMYDWVVGADSMAFDYGARMKAVKAGHSNTMEHRSIEMTHWMEKAKARLAPSAGDQFRLKL